LKAQTLVPTAAGILFHGTTSLAANVEKIQTIKGLAQHTRYYTYLVAETSSSAILQAQPKPSNFITYYRQDTGFYQSAAESRKVLYLIYRPEEVLKYNKKYPILFFLGGNGEVATATKPINYYNFNRTLPEYIKNGNDVPMIVLTIQHTIKNWNIALIDEGVVHGLATYPVDTKKVYMSGCSGGGFATWNYSVAHANKLAAIVPISGGGNTSKAGNLKNVAIWAFHNAIDHTVATSNSQNMINAVNKCSPTKEVKLTLFKDADGKPHHDCWRRVFNQNDKDWSKTPDMPRIDIYAWLLKKSL
jgi:predicted peptidase